jgi:renalase
MGATQSDILIIGAGLSGLMAALSLQNSGRQLLLIDKGAATGGRLATRRLGPGLADTGAQFFTVRDPTFQRYVDEWQAAGLVYIWSKGWSDGSLVSLADTLDGYSRYAVHGGMNALARHLTAQIAAQGVRVETGDPVAAITQSGHGWQATTASGVVHYANTLILTPPVPQSLALLAAGGVRLAEDDHSALERITYAPCLCGIFWLEGEISLPPPGAVQRPGADLAWVADNRRKGISPEATLITVHAGPDYSATHFDTPDDELLATFQATLQPFMQGKIVRRAAQLKRWRYALPTITHPARYLQAQGLPPLFFGGDAFGGPRVEGAALSGLAIGRASPTRYLSPYLFPEL